jgi:DNA invertase Pin-like site-specific DNA recombinase
MVGSCSLSSVPWQSWGESILERQREGIEIAKAEGKYKGRKPVAIDEAKFRATCARWRAGEITATAAMQEMGLKPNTFYRRVKEMNI